MTFASEDVRLKYHQLPTDIQVQYADWESRLAKRGSQLHIYGVIDLNPKCSEVVVGITENFIRNAVHLNLPSSDHSSQDVVNISQVGAVELKSSS